MTLKLNKKRNDWDEYEIRFYDQKSKKIGEQTVYADEWEEALFIINDLATRFNLKVHQTSKNCYVAQ